MLRLAPGVDRYPLVRSVVGAAAAEGGSCLLLCPSVAEAEALGRRLRREGVTTAVVVHDGQFVGVAAPSEPAAARALAALRPTWGPAPAQPSARDVIDYFRTRGGAPG